MEDAVATATIPVLHKAGRDGEKCLGFSLPLTLQSLTSTSHWLTPARSQLAKEPRKHDFLESASTT